MVKTSAISDRIDQLEQVMLENAPMVDCPLNHKFTPGLYIREVFMPKGTLITSQIHKTCHPFFILKGCVSVFSENDGEQLLRAPYSGITMPGTRRVLKIHEDTIWITCHPTDIEPENDSEEAIQMAVALIGVEIIEPHVNELIGGEIKNNIISNKIERP